MLTIPGLIAPSELQDEMVDSQLFLVVDSGFSNLASCLLVRPWNTSGALDCQVPEFSSRVVKEGGCCNFIFGYLCLMLIPRFVVVARAGKGQISFATRAVWDCYWFCSCDGWLMYQQQLLCPVYFANIGACVLSMIQYDRGTKLYAYPQLKFIDIRTLFRLIVTLLCLQCAVLSCEILIPIP